MISLKATIYFLYTRSAPSDPLVVWTQRIKNKVMIDFHYHQAKHNNDLFLKNWNHNNTLFTIINENIFWLI